MPDAMRRLRRKGSEPARDFQIIREIPWLEKQWISFSAGVKRRQGGKSPTNCSKISTDPNSARSASQLSNGVRPTGTLIAPPDWRVQEIGVAGVS